MTEWSSMQVSYHVSRYWQALLQVLYPLIRPWLPLRNQIQLAAISLQLVQAWDKGTWRQMFIACPPSSLFERLTKVHQRKNPLLWGNSELWFAIERPSERILKVYLPLCYVFSGALTVGLVRQCQTIHGRDRTCIPPRLPPEWVTTLFFIIMGIISLTVTCGLLVASHWRREATKYARWIAFTGSKWPQLHSWPVYRINWWSLK